jgi:hypothetical protein
MLLILSGSDPLRIIATGIDYADDAAASNSPLLRVMVTMVGGVTVNMPLGFDTGSVGVTLYAQSVFPASMVSASGFVFPAGQSSISYNGITVTSLQGTRSYGTVNQTVEPGSDPELRQLHRGQLSAATDADGTSYFNFQHRPRARFRAQSSQDRP